MIAALIPIVVTLITEIVQAGNDAEKQTAALMAAEEKLAQMRAAAKFG